MRISLVVLIVMSVFSSCDGRKEVEQVVHYVDAKENGLTKVKEIGPLLYTARFETAEIITLKELGASELNGERFKNLIKERRGYCQINLRISSSDETNRISLFKKIAKDEQQLLELSNYFQHYARADFSFLVDGVSYSPSTYLYVSDNGSTPYEELIVGLDLLQHNIELKFDKIQLVYDDKIFKHGPVYFTYNQKDIKDIPELN